MTVEGIKSKIYSYEIGRHGGYVGGGTEGKWIRFALITNNDAGFWNVEFKDNTVLACFQTMFGTESTTRVYADVRRAQREVQQAVAYAIELSQAQKEAESEVRARYPSRMRGSVPVE